MFNSRCKTSSCRTSSRASTGYFPPFCTQCGERLPPLEPTAIACPTCGGDLVPLHMSRPADMGNKTAMTAGLLSFLLPGAGQVFNGQLFRGLVIFGTCWLIVPWIFGVIDAYCSARRAAVVTSTP
jgi:hypothetical protein